MVETITPAVHGGRRGRWALFLAVHAAGATLAAAAFGALLGVVGGLLGAPWGAAGSLFVATIGGLYLLREALGVPVPVPQLRRQVPDWWRTFFPFGAAAFLYGLGLGVGFLTYLAHGTLVVVATVAVATGRPLLGAALVAPFGLARGMSAAVAARARTPEQGSALIAALARSARRPGWRLAHAVVVGCIVAAASAATRGLESGELAEASAAVLAIAFGVAGMAKAVRARTWRRALASYRLPGSIEGAARAGVPMVELGVAALPLLGFVSTTGVVSLVVLTTFSAAIILARVRVGRRLDCGCFGSVQTRDYRLLLARNAALATIAAAAWTRGTNRAVLGSWSPPTGGDALPAVFVVVGLALTIAVAALGVVTARRGARR